MSIYTGKIRDALAGAVDWRKLAEAWQALHPQDVSKAIGPALLAFLNRIRDALVKALTAVLASLYTEGWVLGQLAAESAVSGQPVDWRGWTPADVGAAEAIAGAGLRGLLQNAGVTIQSIADGRIEELAGVLEETLRSEVTSRPPLPEPLPPALSVSDLGRQLEQVLDNPARAELVAQAEIGRAQAEAARVVYAENAIVEVEISTAHDDKVCPVCEAAAAVGAHPVGTPPMVLLHPRCFPAGTLVSGPRAVAATGRHYEGDLLTIVFARGDDVAVTPNHPVLTPRGWVPAGDLHEGDHVLRAYEWIERALACPDDEQLIFRIEDVAAALAEAGRVASARVPVAAEDFHGDGSPGHDVDVVAAARGAERQADALEREDGADLAFVGGPGLASLGQGDGDPLGLTGGAPASGGVGSVEHGRPPGVAGALPPQRHGLGLIARRDASLAEHAGHGVPVDAVTAGQGLDGLASEEVFGQAGRGGDAPVRRGADADSAGSEHAHEGLVADAAGGRGLAESLARFIGADRVVKVRRIRQWSGHVYNLETVSGWYFANGIVAHNCRCAELPVLAGA